MQVDLTGRTAIVTGAGRGIGRHIATRFADAGADVVAAARTESEIASTVERVEERGVEGVAVPTDLAEPAEVDALVDETLATFGTPDVLVNNAAANLADDPLEQTVADVDTMTAVNLRGPYLLAQRVATEMLAADIERGRIVNVSSIVASLGVPAMTVYGATKAAVDGITRGLAVELAGDGITVNSVSPGLTRVERIERVLAESGESFDLDRIPAGRLAEPEEVADACLFLASEAAGYVTGADLPVDGGVTVTAGLYR